MVPTALTTMCHDTMLKDSSSKSPYTPCIVGCCLLTVMDGEMTASGDKVCAMDKCTSGNVHEYICIIQLLGLVVIF